MTITESRKRTIALGAVGLGLLAAARALRARDDYDFRGKSVVISRHRPVD